MWLVTNDHIVVRMRVHATRACVRVHMHAVILFFCRSTFSKYDCEPTSCSIWLTIYMQCIIGIIGLLNGSMDIGQVCLGNVFQYVNIHSGSV